MSDSDDQVNDTRDGAPGDDSAVERLLRAAGPRPEVPDDRSARVHDAVHLHWRYVVRSRRRLRWITWVVAPLAAAAAWLLFVGPDPSGWIPRLSSPATAVASLERVEGSLTWSGGVSPVAGEEFGTGMTLRTAADGRAAVRLHTGISIRIDGDSSVSFTDIDALAFDRGRVYIDTAGADPNYAGVAITTSFGIVRDIGTQFQVVLASDRLQVSVREGLARIEHDGTLLEAPAGMRIDVGEGGLVTRGEVSASGPEWDWILGLAPSFDLEGALLGRYLEWIGRETGLRIEFADPSIADDAATVTLHGSIDGLRPDETTGVVLPTCGLRQRSGSGAMIIERESAIDQ